MKNTCVESLTMAASSITIGLNENFKRVYRTDSDEYQGSILTNISNSSATITANSLCFDQHVSSSILVEEGFLRLPGDSGIDLYFQTEEQTFPLEKYYEECAKYNAVPVGALARCLEESNIEGGHELNLRSYGLSSIGVYLATKAIIGPPVAQILRLDLSNSQLDEIGCIALSEFLQQSSNLTHLNLSGCPLGVQGAQVLQEGIELSQSLTVLDMQKCHLLDTGGSLIIKATTFNENIKVIDLSHNMLQSVTVSCLEVLFKENRTLETLNLSWNDFYPERSCALPMFKALRRNETLKEVNLAWNGMNGKSFGLALFRAVKAHPLLRVLNLSNNRLTEIELKSIIKMIKTTTSLEELYLGGNVWSDLNILDLIKSVAGDVTLKLLDLGEFTYIPENAYLLAKQITSSKPDVKIIFKGQILPNPPDSIDFRAIIIDRSKFLAMAPKKRKLKRDMGHFMINLMDSEKTHYRNESFVDLLKKFKAKLDPALVGHLTDEFTGKLVTGKGKMVKRVALRELATLYLNRHPTERPPPPPPKKGKKRRKGKKKGKEK